MNTCAPVLVIVDPYGPGASIAPAFRERGWYCVALTTTARVPAPLAHTWRPADFDQHLVHTQDLDALVRSLNRLDPVGVVTGLETGSELTDALCARLFPEYANSGSRSAARRDKAAMQRRLAEAGLASLRQIRTADFAEAESWLRSTGLHDAPWVIVKPARSAGTDAVRRVRPGDGLRAAFEAMKGRRDARGETERTVLVQEWVRGTEYSVETFSVGGVHEICGVTRNSKRSSGSVVGIYDSVEFVAPEDPVCGRLLPYAHAVLDALGARFGPMCAEIMLRPEGPVLIELTPRLADGPVSSLSSLTTGRSQLDRLVDFFHGRYRNSGYRLLRHGTSVFVTAHRSGVIRNPDSLRDLVNLPTVVRSTVSAPPGGWVLMASDVFSVLGCVLLADRERSRVELDRRRIKRVERDLRIDRFEMIEPAVARRGTCVPEPRVRRRRR
ncbi:ATP-grasp domain-containing protein [Streptomyces anulatus]|uniref:ATP-grasp domain-containing protein n=1 Tax=Streptomyces anulatus TaxID=1892 RepID=UPI0022551BE6|nr:ATP-grasp domain-containing protein [Streptomyces anulatus]MCX4502473.1 ATP-grasp domain-containing protein [Streptomyces anulatus]